MPRGGWVSRFRERWMPLSVFGLGVLLAIVGGGSARVLAATCDPPGSPPRFGCQWSETACDWFCAVCDPWGSPPRSGCGWDLAGCNWVCPGYTGTSVLVRTDQSPTLSATVFVKLSSLCTTTGAGAICGGAFSVSAGMPRAQKCESIAGVIAAQCAAAGYAVSANACANEASFTASNVGCPGTAFALGISNDAGVFDQTSTGPLPDGEVETICAPPPGPARHLQVDKIDGGTELRLTWEDAPSADSYVLFTDHAPSGSFNATAGSAASGAPGLDVTMPSGTEFFIVAGSNAACGIGQKR